MDSKLTWSEVQRLIAAPVDEVTSPELCASPLVSVSIVTYQHLAYIRDALDSALAQRTTFAFEIVVGDDCSQDGSFELARELQAQHPDKLRLLRSRENLGRHTGNGRLNQLRNLRACRGKYIALLEGDDYWTDPEKLQLQVERMQENPAYSACIHRVEMVDAAKKPVGGVIPSGPCPASFSVADTLDHSRMFAGACSLLFRNSAELLPPWALHCFMADRVIYSALAARGPIAFVDRTMAHYRRHAGGVTSTVNLRAQYDSRMLYFREIQRTIGVRPETETQRMRGMAYQVGTGFEKFAQVEQPLLGRLSWAAGIPALIRDSNFGGYDKLRLSLEIARDLGRRAGRRLRARRHRSSPAVRSDQEIDD